MNPTLEWLLGAMDTIIAIVFIVIAIANVVSVLMYGFDTRTCGAPNRRQGRCRNPIRTDGSCKANHHRSSWIASQLWSAAFGVACAVTIVAFRPVVALAHVLELQ